MLGQNVSDFHIGQRLTMRHLNNVYAPNAVPLASKRQASVSTTRAARDEFDTQWAS
jgi:hypothetical protein